MGEDIISRAAEQHGGAHTILHRRRLHRLAILENLILPRGKRQVDGGEGIGWNADANLAWIDLDAQQTPGSWLRSASPFEAREIGPDGDLTEPGCAGIDAKYLLHQPGRGSAGPAVGEADVVPFFAVCLQMGV